MTARVTRGSTILILSTDAVTSALLSILAELEGYTPVFAAGDESPADSLSRLRPRLLLVDCDHDAACNDEIFQLAREIGTKVVIFSPGRMREEVREFAEERALPWFALPIDRTTLGQTLRAALTALIPFALLATFGR
jgi:DNA-binding NtrC family response regulator